VTILSVFALDIDYSLSGEYTDNVWHLSDYDLDRLEKGSTSLAFAETADDLIINSDVKISDEYKFSKKFKVIPSAKLAYTMYTNNEEKSRGSVFGGIDFAYRPYTLGLKYGFYPDNYLRDYRDSSNQLYGGTGEYEKFVYDKNLYKADLSWQALKKHRFSGSFKYEEYRHNEFFTEYDSNAMTFELGWRGSFPGLYLLCSYAYREYNTIDEIADLYVGDFDPDDIPSDSSYEGNLYSISFMMKKIKTENKSLSYRPVLDVNVEKRFYQGSDEYHAHREDTTIDISPSVSLYIGKNIDITLDYSYLNRTVESPYTSVSKYKDYSATSVSLSFSYRYDLFE
jgi:hypothetical protein